VVDAEDGVVTVEEVVVEEAVADLEVPALGVRLRYSYNPIVFLESLWQEGDRTVSSLKI
jgi:hypothetical protein